ncbi:MAG: hypothetical protein AAF439_09600 [Pseudomonadota bacterium]
MLDQTTAIARAEAALREARAELDSEIRSYPMPISGCDAQYNHLLAERKRVHSALMALAEPIHIPTPREP